MPITTKRTLLKAGLAAWATPVITVIALPTHAQMSPLCSGEQIAGEWNFIFGDSIHTLTLNSDGTGVDSSIFNDPVTWTIDGDQFTVTIPNLDRTYDGIISSSCNTATGIDITNNDPFTADKS